MSFDCFIEPVDVLSFRGNRMFGDPGSFGESMMPPAPSVMAGAIRTLVLAQDEVDLAAFAGGGVAHPELGSRDAAGAFHLAAFQPAFRSGDRVAPLFGVPADALVHMVGEEPRLSSMRPAPLEPRVLTSSSLPMLPVLGREERDKSQAGWWLTCAGWQAWLEGGPVQGRGHLVHQDQIWKDDLRTGIRLESRTRRADDGALLSVLNIAPTLHPDLTAGFAARVQGLGAREGILRLGGDGRAAKLTPAAVEWPRAPLERVLEERRGRLVLTNPGLFDQGWLPNGVSRASDGSYVFELHGVRARLAAVAAGRPQLISGFDLARWEPKSAGRAVPPGAVYWIDELEADEKGLTSLLNDGLWTPPMAGAPRWAEGFNRCTLGAWSSVALSQN